MKRGWDFGDFEMRNYAELKDDPAYIEWISGNNEDNICPNGESGAQVTARALEALKPVISEGVDAVVVAHGGVPPLMRRLMNDHLGIKLSRHQIGYHA